MNWTKTLNQQLLEVNFFDLALRGTLALFLFSEWVHGKEWYYSTPIFILSVLGILIPFLLRNKILWYLLSLLFVLKTIQNWWIQDNHLFVNTYWVLTIAFSLSMNEPQKVLRENARMMIGLIFLFATVWKIISPDFISGAYFHYSFLTDLRFWEESKIFGGLTLAEMKSNIAKVDQASAGGMGTAKLITNPQIMMVTRIITWHTALIESLLAILFLLPDQWKLTSYRNYLLIIFALTTYLTMPIHSFSWLLIIVAISQTHEGEKLDRVLLIACLPIMFIYRGIPFMDWIANNI